jgi:uncharacterized glyoxalase superfamily protein PhnB
MPQSSLMRGVSSSGGGQTRGVTSVTVVALAGKARIVMPLETTCYGMRELAIADPDGVVLKFAETLAA